jgi:hypothetical protein
MLTGMLATARGTKLSRTWNNHSRRSEFAVPTANIWPRYRHYTDDLIDSGLYAGARERDGSENHRTDDTSPILATAAFPLS